MIWRDNEFIKDYMTHMVGTIKILWHTWSMLIKEQMNDLHRIFTWYNELRYERSFQMQY